MKIEGIWKAAGRLSSYNNDLIIKDGVMELSVFGKETEKGEYVLTECNKYKDLTEEVKYISLSDRPNHEEMILHEEEHDGHLISILSFMTMEYDGRGLIVLLEYVHEDDYQYISSDFTSNIYHFHNDREVTPMMNMDKSSMLGMGMMGMQGTGQMPSKEWVNIMKGTE